MFSAILLSALAGAVELGLAPDQPLPHVYVDDPLILELRSDQDTEASVELSVQPEQGAPVVIQLPALKLRAHGARWVPVKDLPSARGQYHVQAKITIGGAVEEQAGDFFRIDRPPARPVTAAYAHGADADRQALLALSSVGIKTMRLNASREDIQERLKEAAQQDFKVVIHLDLAQLSEPGALVTQLASSFCGDIVRWEIDPHGDPRLLGQTADTIRKTGCNASLAVVVPDAETLRGLLQYKSGHQVREAVLLSDAPSEQEIATIRQLIEQAGYESWSIYVLGRGVAAGAANPGEALVQQIAKNLAAGALQTGFARELVYDGALQPALVYLNGLGHRFVGVRFVGALDLGAGVVSLVFREDEGWLLVVWANTEQKVLLPLQGTDKVSVTDTYNNKLAVNKGAKGALSVTAAPAPIFVSGRGGAIMAEAAKNEARRHAQDFQYLFQNVLGGDIQGVVAAVGSDPSGSNARVNYFTLLRALPELERRWHAGELPRSVAVPAIAQVARLARALATVEEERDEPFLEPLQDTLARGEEYQSLYLTGSTGTSQANERGDWLLNEVRRLLDEAEQLATTERKIEANAVAALAEWRARGLEFAAHAKPMSEDAEPVILANVPPLPGAPAAPEGATPPAAPAAPEMPAPEPQQTVHKVAKGESPSVIAAKYKVKTDDLLAWNKLTKRSKLKIGQELVIKPAGAAVTPAPAPEPPPAQTAPAPPEEPPAAAAEPQKTHKVARGENPSIIAGKYKVSLDNFLKWNNFTKRVRLQVGQEVLVSAPGAAAAAEPAPPAKPAPAPETPAEPAPAAPPAEPEPAPAASAASETVILIHTVQRGDTPASIAAKYGMNLEAFRKRNGLKRDATLRVGKRYEVLLPADQAAKFQGKATAETAPAAAPAEANSGAPAGTQKSIHKVERGESPYTISKKHGVALEDFLRWNKLNKSSVLHIGDEYVVYKE
ncbi:MAG: LysM peptidoglycan-binding domain-containing protein [Candidatus Hydrogenedentes bacterium]|nr:LysM peptidoglycan-binding domain-containing protein [Candidatus Hydrogenedentota bacterium]MBI3117766.1 LysM peptidoglycan-binding domain-containing protein [Candidatus Hydrogenedentota bacterium]